MHLNRRQFAATGIAAALAGRALGQPAKPAPERIPLGFLGTTYSHGPAKLKLARSSPDWELVGAAETSETGRRTCAELGVPVMSAEELLRRVRVVAVESDIPDHAAQARLALEAGCHVHLEKPPALRFADVESLVSLARRRERLLQTGFMWRYHPGFEAIFDAVRHGWLGDVFLVRAHLSNFLSPERRRDWAAFPGGAMFELGSHLVDATVRLLGRTKRVTPFLRSLGAATDGLADTNVAVLEYDRATAVLTNTALQSAGTPPRSFEVCGTRGTATLAPLEPGELVFDLNEAAGPYARGKQTVRLPEYRRYEGDFAELAAAVRGERPLRASLDDELAVAETLFRICAP